MNNMSKKSTLISAVVCTYNRSGILLHCLKSLLDQENVLSHFEVIIVNNNSTDNTQHIAEEFAKKNSNFRVVIEQSQGLSHSRNRGWQEASGEYVAYIDDDAKAPPDWISKMLSFINRHPDIMVFGGPYEGFSPVPLPNWFPPEYGSLKLKIDERPINIGYEWISGTNMVYKKSLLSSLNGFHTGLGMSGGKISYGEETRLLLEIAKKNIPVYYVPDMKVFHLIAEYKISLKWLLLSSYSVGLTAREIFMSQRSFKSHAAGLFRNFFSGLKKMFFLPKMPFMRRVYYSFRELFLECGGMVNYFKNLFDKVASN